MDPERILKRYLRSGGFEASEAKVCLSRRQNTHAGVGLNGGAAITRLATTPDGAHRLGRQSVDELGEGPDRAFRRRGIDITGELNPYRVPDAGEGGGGFRRTKIRSEINPGN